MKLWEKGEPIDSVVERFTVGNDRELDMRLARYDLLGSLAHAKMLHHVGLLESEEFQKVESGLNQLLEEVERGEFTIEDEYEDVHSKVEAELTKRIGEAGKRIHTARSRNDQVLLDLHLWGRDEVEEIRHLLRDLFERLIGLSDAHANNPMPGYTHMQIAMPSSFGLWFGAYAELLIDDLTMLNAAKAIADQNPLGSAAGYGSSFPIDREMTTDELGFSTLRINAMGAGLSRGKLEWTIATAVASVAMTLGRLAMDIVLYTGGNFDLVRFPASLTTGSSIMPHKKNPDVFELIRAHCNTLRGLPNQIALLTTNLPGGYHRDYQLLKEILFPGVDQLKTCLQLADYMLQQVEVNREWVNDERYHYLYTVEEVSRLVADGMPFRDAYRIVGDAIANGTYQPKPGEPHTHQGSTGNLCNAEIRAKFEKVYSE
ncbi:MAG: argininosuccinate lyase [Ignavibacteriae bacterium]|nr:argininosuccinate lyase [Ignavibacteriota bacterium]MCB9215403.1 argininosuccinate lyase [Ignavibacteria bacterium]